MEPAPRVWLLVGDRRGDNRQAEVVAQTTGWPFEQKYVRVLDEFARTKPEVVPTIDHLDPALGDPLTSPWPDLVITMGRRLSMVALWIQQQSDRPTKLVLVGKSSGMDDAFDLVVVSAENPIPRRPNVHPVGFPLLRVDDAAVSAAGETWKPRLASMTRPLMTLLVGGPTKPFIFREDDARRMIERVTEFASENRSSLFVTTSPRTPDSFLDVLREGLRDGDRLHCFGEDDENPYLGLLALADSFVVTGDSISMLVEVARLDRPLAIYPLEVQRARAMTRLRRGVAARILSSTTPEKPGAARRRAPLLEPLGYALYRSGRIRHARDFPAIHDLLFERGLAVPFGQAFAQGSQTAPDELSGVADRIRALMQAA